MSRADGRKANRERTASPWPATGEEAEIGASPGRTQGTPSDIPGGRPHISNAPTHRQIVPTPPARPEIRGMNAHGVLPGTFTTRDRADLEQGRGATRPDPTHFAELTEPVAPVPVYLVEGARGPVTIRTAMPHKLTVQANTGEPVRLCGLDRGRVKVGLLNEDPTNGIRFAWQPGDLAGGAGGLLPGSATSYQWFDTQDELWGISNTGSAATISVVQVFEQQMGG